MQLSPQAFPFLQTLQHAPAAQAGALQLPVTAGPIASVPNSASAAMSLVIPTPSDDRDFSDGENTKARRRVF
jgi:hypothetical protein